VFTQDLFILEHNYNMQKSMTEDFLQYIWRYQLFNKKHTINDDIIEIIDVGQLNTDSGPDFFNAKIKINDTIWVGNVEIHKKSSDWFAHHHETDKAYNNVILHVVDKINKDVFDAKGRIIPQIELKYNKNLLDNYSAILNSKHKIKCENEINNINNFELFSWLDTLLIERLERKAESINILLKDRINDWEEVFYILLLRQFGLKVNAEAFEMLARSLPLKNILKQNDKLISIEAMLFGQASFLSENINDEYFTNLKTEYKFLKNKYTLSPIDIENWKFMRVRPISFPTVRIAQTASLLFNHSNIFSKIIEIDKLDDLYKLFDIEPSKYWKTHYKFGISSKEKTKKIGKSTIDLIIINVIAPMIFMYGKERNIPKLKDKALFYLQELKAENNSIIKYCSSIGLKSKTSAESQALLELYNNYCQKSNCLNCRIGNILITKNILSLERN